jgi:riboflavin kinase/FMN adenylyltransferase
VAGQQHRLEVHVFDWQGNAYGKKINISLMHRLRDEIKFASLEELKQQIQQDVSDARHLIQTNFLMK